MNFCAKISLVLYVITVCLLSGCSSTSVTGVWKKSDYSGQPLQSILVVALAGNKDNKILWENIMADQLSQSGLSALASTNSFPGDPEITKDEIVEFVQNQGIEGVLVTRMVDTKKEKVYYPPTGRYNNHFGNYYPYAYNRVYTSGYTAGYTSTHTTVLLETKLYLADTQELIWSMSSDTFDPRSLNQLAESVGKKVINNLKKDNLVLLTK